MRPYMAVSFNRGMNNAASSLIPPVPLPSRSGHDARATHAYAAAAGCTHPPARRQTAPPQRFYTPSGVVDGQSVSHASVSWPGTIGLGGFASPSETVPAKLSSTGSEAPPPRNVVVVDAATAGIGTSTLTALLARELAERGLKCVLVDADLNGGGLDVLLGVEDEDGTRFGDISAPLGNIDGKALLRELPSWEGVPLLACDPWKSENPQAWEIQACVRSLAQVRDAVLVDVGQWHGLRDATELARATRITVVELTVLGLARAKTAMQSHSAAQEQRHCIVGIEPRGVVRDHGVATLEEAEAYLDRTVTAAIKPDARLCSELLDGLGLRKPNRQTAKALSALADDMQEAMEHKRVGHGTRTP